MKQELRLVLSTISSRDEAVRLGRELVQEGLAACVSIVPGCLSIYEWDGKLEEESECLLLFKTSARRLPELMEALSERHPYELPERLAFEPIESGRDYLSWVLRQVEGA